MPMTILTEALIATAGVSVAALDPRYLLVFLPIYDDMPEVSSDVFLNVLKRRSTDGDR